MEKEVSLVEHYKGLLDFFGGKHEITPSIWQLMDFFKSAYTDIILEGRKCIVDLSRFKKNSNEYRERFKEDWQPITITYRRQDIVFFTWDNYPQYGEEYFIIDELNLMTRNTYPQHILLSELYSKKIEWLKDNERELKLQVSMVEFDDLDGRITIENDLQHLMISLDETE